MKKNRLKYSGLTLLAGLFFSSAVAANSLSDEIVRAQTNTQLLQAKIAEAEAKAKLDGLLNITPSGSTIGQSDATSTTVNDVPVPYLVAIYGRDKTLIATLRFPNGLTVDVSRGDTIDGGYRVRDIRSTGVTLVRDGKNYALNTFPGAAALNAERAQSAANAASTMVPIQGMPVPASRQGAPGNFGGSVRP